ncbi:hypothetical protein BMS3Bbin04_01987 [bacterium BMS3Bbin04]|nr:hypothetical protein BMS3Bbin04_01987 [bacterium BMS3Bbin04]
MLTCLKPLLVRAIDRLPYRLTFILQRKYYLRKLRNISSDADQDLSVIPQLVVEGDSVIDIGANYGLWTRFLAESTGKNGKVLAIEPVPRTYDILKYCVVSLGIGNIETLHAAVSDQDGKATISVPDYRGRVNYYRASLDNRHQRKSPHSFEVRTFSVDTLVTRYHGLAAPSFIKCDVEGHELAVVNGAKLVVEKSLPSWLIELGSHPDEDGTDANQIKRYFESVGYSDYVFADGKFTPRKEGETSVNYIFIHESRLQGLRLG